MRPRPRELSFAWADGMSSEHRAILCKQPIDVALEVMERAALIFDGAAGSLSWSECDAMALEQVMPQRSLFERGTR